MQIYNSNTDKLENVRIVAKDGSACHVTLNNEATLNSMGYYFTETEQEQPIMFYTKTTPNNYLQGNKYILGWNYTEKSLADIQDSMIQQIEQLVSNMPKPDIDTGLGFSVSGDLKDLQLIEIAKKRGRPTVRGTDHVSHTVNPVDYDAIIDAIETAGEALYDAKYAKIDAIKALGTVQACIDYVDAGGLQSL